MLFTTFILWVLLSPVGQSDVCRFFFLAETILRAMD